MPTAASSAISPVIAMVSTFVVRLGTARRRPTALWSPIPVAESAINRNVGPAAGWAPETAHPIANAPEKASSTARTRVTTGGHAPGSVDGSSHRPAA